MNPNITIVTAFFDIGRSNWTPDNGHPHYLQRTNETYMERFSYMSQLENEIIVYTTSDFKQRILDYRQDRPTKIIETSLDEYSELRNKISAVQQSEKFQKLIHPSQVKNPEYWNADYVVVNALKSSFVNKAIQANVIETDLVAWMDFGYCRDETTLDGVRFWEYPFDKEKIHFFNIKDWVEGTFIQDVIANNDVHITGPCIVADKKMWPTLEALVYHSIDELLKNNLIDDDQTLLLMSYLQKPELFELHPVSNQDWFVAFRDYNVNPD